MASDNSLEALRLRSTIVLLPRQVNKFSARKLCGVVWSIFAVRECMLSKEIGSAYGTRTRDLCLERAAC